MILEYAYIAIGSNLGDKRTHCENAVSALAHTPKIEVLQTSPWYRTAPVDYLDQDWFVNGVVQIRTKLDPIPLFRALKSIETAAGQGIKAIRFGPRLIDLDILLYGSQVIDLPELIIPHPRMHKRCFVLRPLCDIEPSIVHPTLGQSMENLLIELDATDQEVTLI